MRMNKQDMLNELNKPKYSFLNDINKILLVPGGSISYGTDVDYIMKDGTHYTSDFDIRGIFLDDKESLFGFKEQIDFAVNNGDVDCCLYSLKRILKLLESCNPNTIEIVGNDADHTLYETECSKLLKDNLSIFITKKAVNSFGKYATAQMRRMKNALARDSSQIEKENNIRLSLKANMQDLKDKYAPFSDDEVKLYIDKSSRKDMDSELFMDINLKHFSLRDYSNIMNSMTNTIRNFSKLNHRNRKKDALHLYKHAMHLVRLQMMLYYILSEGLIMTYLPKEDRSLLIDIRMERYSIDEIFKINDEWVKRNAQLAATTKLPDYTRSEDVNKLAVKLFSLFY